VDSDGFCRIPLDFRLLFWDKSGGHVFSDQETSFLDSCDVYWGYFDKTNHPKGERRYGDVILQLWWEFGLGSFRRPPTQSMDNELFVKPRLDSSALFHEFSTSCSIEEAFWRRKWSLDDDKDTERKDQIQSSGQAVLFSLNLDGYLLLLSYI